MRTFGAAEIGELLSRDRRNRWISWSEIGQATLKQGIVDHSLHLTLGDGRRAKFLWLRSDGGYELLEERLGKMLHGRFRALHRPIG